MVVPVRSTVLVVRLSMRVYVTRVCPWVEVLEDNNTTRFNVSPAITTILFLLTFFLCPCMALNVSVQYNGGLLPDIILLTQCYYHRGTRLNAMKRFCICSL